MDKERVLEIAKSLDGDTDGLEDKILAFAAAIEAEVLKGSEPVYYELDYGDLGKTVIPAALEAPPKSVKDVVIVSPLYASPQPCPKCETLKVELVAVATIGRDREVARKAAEATCELLRKESGMQHTMLVAAEARCAKIRQETIEECAEIADEEGNEWDSDRLLTFKNYAHAVRDRIRALKGEKT